jgi:hypothetical protein
MNAMDVYQSQEKERMEVDKTEVNPRDGSKAQYDYEKKEREKVGGKCRPEYYDKKAKWFPDEIIKSKTKEYRFTGEEKAIHKPFRPAPKEKTDSEKQIEFIAPLTTPFQYQIKSRKELAGETFVTESKENPYNDDYAIRIKVSPFEPVYDKTIIDKIKEKMKNQEPSMSKVKLEKHKQNNFADFVPFLNDVNTQDPETIQKYNEQFI